MRKRIIGGLMAAVAPFAFVSAAAAEDFGDFSLTTLQTLTTTYAGRNSGTAAFDGAADWMVERFEAAGLTVSRQAFTTRRGLSSQNVITSIAGTSADFILVGAHFDTAAQRSSYTGPPLQGVDDNGSGASVLTELAAHMSGLELETGLVFNAFGAEESGLEGSRYYRNSLTAAEIANLKGMINIDSLITGDFMYAHADVNYLTDPSLKSYWTRIHEIAVELGYDLRSNPGLNASYPIDTGCCSDADSFSDLNIPILWLESTNWEIGALDGYDQTTNPGIPGGASWHNPAIDNWAVLEAAFGPDRIPDRLEAYSLLLTRLLIEITGADVLATAASGGEAAYRTADHLVRGRTGFEASVDRMTLSILDAPREIGAFTLSVGVEGSVAPSGGFDDRLDLDGTRSGRAYVHGDFQFDPLFNIGGDLQFARSRDDIGAGGDLSSSMVSMGANLVYGSGISPWAVASVSASLGSLSGTRAFHMTSGLGATLLDQRFDYETDAQIYGARLMGGHDFAFGDIAIGPVLGLDYAHYRIGGYSESSALRTALSIEAQTFDSLETTVGVRLRGSFALAEALVLSPYGSVAYVHEFSDGMPEDVVVSAMADGTARRVSFAGADDSYGRAQLGAALGLGDGVATFIQLDSRIGHDDGAETGVTAGLGLTF
ncbi:MAG: autotransporter domain-containing protein [Zavarzinia sp.]|nr:autotransporter domain-containing protein [Zavarzinia sp.]